jgi:hypothetical protein
MIADYNNSYKVEENILFMKSKLLLTSVLLFVLVLLGVYTMIMVEQSKQFSWIEPFMPLIVLTGFFIFIISAGLFVYSLVKILKS